MNYKILTIVMCLITQFVCGFAADKEVVDECDFTKLNSWQDRWTFFDSNYYRPYGNVTNDSNGMKITTNGKRESLIHSKKAIDVAPDEEFDLIAVVSTTEETPLFFGLIEYLDGTVIKNDLAYARTNGDSKIVRLRMKASFNGKSFNKAYLSAGTPKGKEITLKSVKLIRRPPDDDKLLNSLPSGVQHHFDASKKESLVVKNGYVVEWKDRSGKKLSLFPVRKDSAPKLIENNLNKRAVCA